MRFTVFVIRDKPWSSVGDYDFNAVALPSWVTYVQVNPNPYNVKWLPREYPVQYSIRVGKLSLNAN